MNKNKMMVLLIAASMMAGCAEIIPEPPNSVEGENPPEWKYVNGTYTIIIGDNNTTAPLITVGNNSTWLQIHSVTLNASHLSFEVDGNTITFHNYTFTLGGYLNQSGYLWNEGYASNIGNATLHTPDFPYDITIEYSIVYREWTGKE
jgi:hypothetical protein